MSESLLLAVALVLIIEGLAPALFPNRWRSYVIKIAQLPLDSIRVTGIILMLLGCGLLWLIN
ncbi:MAG: DUF2065 domain-containing protein [Colwellia sp.]